MVLHGGGAGEARVSRKQEPNTRRASATMAVSAMRNRDGLAALAAPRRDARAGQMRATVSESWSSSCRSGREKRMTGSVGSPQVATGRIRGVFTKP